MGITLKELAQNWSTRGHSAENDIETIVQYYLNHPKESKFLEALVGGLLKVIDDNNSKNLLHLTSLSYNLQRIACLASTACEQRKDPSAAIADAMLLSFTAKPSDFDTLDISQIKDVRARKAIRKSGCQTAAELAAYGEDRLLVLRNVGISTVSIIREFLLARHGLTLASGGKNGEPKRLEELK